MDCLAFTKSEACFLKQYQDDVRTFKMCCVSDETRKCRASGILCQLVKWWNPLYLNPYINSWEYLWQMELSMMIWEKGQRKNTSEYWEKESIQSWMPRDINSAINWRNVAFVQIKSWNSEAGGEWVNTGYRRLRWQVSTPSTHPRWNWWVYLRDHGWTLPRCNSRILSTENLLNMHGAHHLRADVDRL